LAPAVLQELEPPPVDETAPEHSAGAARGRSNWHRGGRAQSSWEGHLTTSWGGSRRPSRGAHLSASVDGGGGLGGAVGPGGPSGDDSCSFMFCSLILGGVDHLHYRLCCQGPSIATASHVSLCLERCQAQQGKFRSPLWKEAPQLGA